MSEKKTFGFPSDITIRYYSLLMLLQISNSRIHPFDTLQVGLLQPRYSIIKTHIFISIDGSLGNRPLPAIRFCGSLD